jgi:hypothetical protein
MSDKGILQEHLLRGETKYHITKARATAAAAKKSAANNWTKQNKDPSVTGLRRSTRVTFQTTRSSVMFTGLVKRMEAHVKGQELLAKVAVGIVRPTFRATLKLTRSGEVAGASGGGVSRRLTNNDFVKLCGVQRQPTRLRKKLHEQRK